MTKASEARRYDPAINAAVRDVLAERLRIVKEVEKLAQQAEVIIAARPYPQSDDDSFIEEVRSAIWKLTYATNRYTSNHYDGDTYVGNKSSSAFGELVEQNLAKDAAMVAEGEI